MKKKNLEENIINNSYYKKTWASIKDLIIKDLNPNKDTDDENLDNTIISNYENTYILDIEKLFKKIFGYYKFCSDCNILNISMSEWFEPNKEKMIKYYNQEKIERYKIKKGENRQRRMRVGLIVQGYINILSEIENSLE